MDKSISYHRSNQSNWMADFQNISPIFAPIQHYASFMENLPDWPAHSDYKNIQQTIAEPIMTRSGKLIQFIQEKDSLSGAEFSQSYESRIYLSGEVQTRLRNWHDLFNALMWMTFPRIKAILNQIHYKTSLMEAENKTKHRSAVRDAATLFDESGVIVVSSREKLIQLLKAHEWKQLFWQYREEVLSTMRFFVFGHGLYEKALSPYIGMTGKGIILVVDDAYFNQPIMGQLKSIEPMLESFLLNRKLFSTDLTPVPILGYPGWHQENSKIEFYDNTQYFRPHPQYR